MIFDDLLKLVFGTGPVEASITIPVGSGYDAAADIATRVALLERLQAEAIALFPADPLPGGKWGTKCNYGLEHVAAGLNCFDLQNRNATCIVKHAAELCILDAKHWREDSWARAVQHAMAGGLAFVGIEAPPGEAHGHVASVAPRAMGNSPSWHEPVPYLANVGKPPNDIKMLSACFLESEIPLLRCFLWTP